MRVFHGFRNKVGTTLDLSRMRLRTRESRLEVRVGIRNISVEQHVVSETRGPRMDI